VSEIADVIDEVRVALADEASDILPDTCSFTGPGTETRDADGYVSTSDSSIASGIPCEYKPLSVFERERAGEVAQNATHRLKIPANTTTLNISGSARGVIAARGLSPALNFEVTGRLDDSIGIFLQLAIVMKG
jgi:hypothetical protein